MAKILDNEILEHQQKRRLSVSVIIPTYKRGHLLKHVLEALTNQTSGDFEVLMIVKPSGDATEKVIEEYSGKLKVRVIIQKQGYVVDALNLGLTSAQGEIIVFLDDDAIPFPNLIQSYITTYASPEIGGVAGDVIPVTLKGDTISKSEDISEIITLKKKNRPESIFTNLSSRPLKGLESYMIYLSKAGIVSLNYEAANRGVSQSVNSLLAKGANMSISSKASVGFKFPTSWVLGLTFEQYLGWYLWKKGYHVIFNPKIKAYHIHHGQSLSRNVKDAKKEAILYTESRILFYRLYGREPELSIFYRLVMLITETIIETKAICLNKEGYRISKFINKISIEMLGLRWLIYKKN